MKELNIFRKFIQENEVHEGTWGYGSKKNMIKALSMFELLNTEEANKRLQEAKKELRNRRRK